MIAIDQSPLKPINFDKIESIELINNQNKKYKITISNNSTILQFKIEDTISFPPEIYNYETNLEKLQKINRFFLLFQSLEEVNKTLIKLVQEKNLTIVAQNDICQIKIKNQINGEEFTIEAKKTKIENNELTEKTIIPIIKELKNKIENLENENKEFKNKIEKLENENKELKNKNLNLENKMNEIEKRIKNLEEKNENKIIKSNIINNNELKIILNWIPTNSRFFELIFDTNRDGDSVDSFKNKCEGQSPTLVIVKTETGVIFGGYATSSWKEEGPIEDNNSFCFSLYPNKKYNLTYQKNALYGYRFNDIMFQFGCCYFRIAPNCTQNYNNYISPFGDKYYKKGLYDLDKINPNCKKGEDRYFKVNRLEIFKIK